MIFLNFKIYDKTSHQHTLTLCQIVKKVNQEFGDLIIPCLLATDIYKIKKELDIEVWAQHADPVDYGKHTGWQAPVSLKSAGASGTIINHNEHKVSFSDLKKTKKLCDTHKLKTLMSVDTLDLLKKATVLNPDYIMLEDSKVIGGPVPMIDAQTDIIKKSISIAKQPFIVGGGIRTKEHVKKSLKVGAVGVIVASEIVFSPDPEFTMRDLALGFK